MRAPGRWQRQNHQSYGDRFTECPTERCANTSGNTTARGRDRNENGIPDADESLPGLELARDGTGPLLRWEAAATDWYPETAASLPQAPWLPLTTPSTPADGLLFSRPASTNPSGFFRLRRTW